MTDRDKVIAAYICQNEKLPDKRCETCPYGYEYLDQTGDNYFVWCNTERMMVDAIDMLRAQEPVEPIRKEVGHGWALYRCGKYGNSIVVYQRFCAKCGKEAKWK